MLLQSPVDEVKKLSNFLRTDASKSLCEKIAMNTGIDNLRKVKHEVANQKRDAASKIIEDYLGLASYDIFYRKGMFSLSFDRS